MALAVLASARGRAALFFTPPRDCDRAMRLILQASVMGSPRSMAFEPFPHNAEVDLASPPTLSRMDRIVARRAEWERVRILPHFRPAAIQVARSRNARPPGRRVD